MTTMDRKQVERWATPITALVLGLVMLGAFSVADEVDQGLWALGVMAAYATLLVVGRRFEPVALLGGDAADERGRHIAHTASLLSGYVVLTVILVSFVWEVAHGHDGEPWSQLAAISGASFIVSVVILRSRT